MDHGTGEGLMEKSLLICAVLLAVSQASGEENFLRAGYMAPPRIDGVLQEKEWDAAAEVPAFHKFAYQKTQPCMPGITRAWIGYDRDHLFFAFRCKTKNGKKIPQKIFRADDAVHKDDSVEVFLCVNRKEKEYLQLTVSAHGIRSDAYCFRNADARMTSWNSPLWKSAAGIDSEGYTVEIAVPRLLFWSDDVTVNLARNAREYGENHTALPISGISWHVPEHFAALRGIRPQMLRTVTADFSLRTFPVLGRNQVRARFCNRGGTDAGIVFYAAVDGRKREKQLFLKPGETKECPLEYELLQEKGCIAFGSEVNGKLLFQTPESDYAIPEYSFLLPAVFFAGAPMSSRLCLNRIAAELETAELHLDFYRAGEKVYSCPFKEEIPRYPPLASGEYEMVLQIRDKDKVYLDKRRFIWVNPKI